jgi:hypothetical protein
MQRSTQPFVACGGKETCTQSRVKNSWCRTRQHQQHQGSKSRSRIRCRVCIVSRTQEMARITERSTRTSPLIIRFISHGTLDSVNLQESRRFYEEVFGFEVVQLSKVSLLLRKGGEQPMSWWRPATPTCPASARGVFLLPAGTPRELVGDLGEPRRRLQLRL